MLNIVVKCKPFNFEIIHRLCKCLHTFHILNVELTESTSYAFNRSHITGVFSVTHLKRKIFKPEAIECIIEQNSKKI